MNKPYIDYIKVVNLQTQSVLNTAEIKIFCIWIAIDEFLRGQFLTELRLALFKHMLLKHQYSLGKFIVANEYCIDKHICR